MASDDTKESRQVDHWQRKYYDSLGELEDKEKEWEGLEAILRILVARLTLISSTENKQLEKKLDRLREGMRSDRKLLRLSPQIEEVSGFIIQDDSKKKTNVNTENPAEILKDLLDELKIPKALQRQEKHVRKKLDKAQGDRDIPELIKDIAELLGLTIEHSVEANVKSSVKGNDKNTDEKKSGLFKSLFSDNKEKNQGDVKEKEEGSDKEQPKQIADEANNIEQTATSKDQQDEFEVVDESDESYPPEKDPDAEEEVNEYEALSVKDIAYAGEILIQLLEKMELPNDLCVEAGLIRQRLEPCDKHEILQRGLESTIALVADAHSRALDEKKEMETFLHQLTERLHDIDQSLQETARLREKSVLDTRGMNDAVREEVRNIEESAEKAQDLSSLQTAIQSRVIIIRNHMDSFLRKEKTGEDSYKGIAHQLDKQLDNAKAEIESLREKLEAERKLSMLDALTEMPNRKAYDVNIKSELDRFERYGSEFVLIAIDIDHFKAINDEYGHAAGDKVLKIIGRIINDNVRGADLPARYGGEEFVVILPETDVDQALIVAEKLRAMIEDCAFHFRKKRVVITASFGIALCKKGDVPVKLFNRADAMLYQAKENGRNRCEVAE